ncbi:MAG: Nif3-like dinuclear metal center hexameric protein, partial [Pygmaiobacter sp.]
MPRVEEVRAYLAELAPVDLAESWDNVGTLVDCGGDVTSILVALDITEEVVVEAEMMGCQLIVSHHPVIFKPLRAVTKTDVVYRMIKKNISGICMHTNLDAAEGGVNDILAAIFRLTEVQKLDGLGRVGRLRTPTTATQIAAACKEKFNTQVRFVETGKQVALLALVGGSGGD